ncbi:hypothetical protein SAMN05216249_11163 [Acetitomaculum ruminis DSM 5522]|uniref:Carrier domain-containing protein n=1 Tax=Acetitomaculum ruminis DSM 5522 TaxID=1120918 RepID=A0A1I0YWJ1_9FIRM|nr:acyl carrier protein [Acetitomaculum ruminis]SFB16760.1 hypothetical protein SAMN05216249_11163 [Acetitomaculum ruminis DSM 5522]
MNIEKVIEVLNEVKPGVDFSKENDLVERHILSSMEIVMLVSELSEEFDVDIPLPEVVPENFYSAQTIAKLIERMEDED